MIGKKIEKIKNSTLLLDVDGAPTNKHKFFVEDASEGREFDPVKQFNTHEALMTRKSNRLTLEQLKTMNLPSWVDDEYLKEMSKKRSKKYKELATRLKRFESLRKLELSYDLKPVVDLFRFFLRVYN